MCASMGMVEGLVWEPLRTNICIAGLNKPCSLCSVVSLSTRCFLPLSDCESVPQVLEISTSLCLFSRWVQKSSWSSKWRRWWTLLRRYAVIIVTGCVEPTWDLTKLISYCTGRQAGRRERVQRVEMRDERERERERDSE